MLWHHKRSKAPEAGSRQRDEQQRLAEIILHGTCTLDRWEAIRNLQDEDLRADLACRVQEEEDARLLINGIHCQLTLFRLAVNEKNETYVRLYALQWIYEPETLRIIAETENARVRSMAFRRIVDSARTPERLRLLANDCSLPLYHRMMAALRLWEVPEEGSEILRLDGTLIYRESDVVRHMIEKTKTRLWKQNGKEGTS